MKVVVTGGAGFVGSNLTRNLMSRGHEVIVIDDLSTGLLDNIPTGVEFIKSSILDKDLIGKVISGSKVVVHLAARGSVPRSLKNPIATHEVIKAAFEGRSFLQTGCGQGVGVARLERAVGAHVQVG